MTTAHQHIHLHRIPGGWTHTVFVPHAEGGARPYVLTIRYAGTEWVVTSRDNTFTHTARTLDDVRQWISELKARLGQSRQRRTIAQVAATRAARLALVALLAVAPTVVAAGGVGSSAAGFPIQARDNAASVRAEVQAGVRAYSTSPRARVTNVTRIRRGLWDARTTAGHPYRSLRCTLRYCWTTPTPQAPSIRVEVTR